MDDVNGVLGGLMLAADVWAIVRIVMSNTTRPRKVLWSLLVVALPLAGVLVWLLFGPREDPAYAGLGQTDPDTTNPASRRSSYVEWPVMSAANRRALAASDAPKRTPAEYRVASSNSGGRRPARLTPGV